MRQKAIRLVIIRHGESIWNKSNRFTGWADVPLSEKGICELKLACDWINQYNMRFDIAFTSVLKRSVQSFNYIAENTDHMHIPLIKTWRLNERHYGALQGLNREEMIRRYGINQIQTWTRSYIEGPPPMSPEEHYKLCNEEKYKYLDKSLIPWTEVCR
jgi:2,3-bisphosphoglycerate-dependent phosphoglycerate mutase